MPLLCWEGAPLNHCQIAQLNHCRTSDPILVVEILAEPIPLVALVEAPILVDPISLVALMEAIAEAITMKTIISFDPIPLVALVEALILIDLIPLVPPVEAMIMKIFTSFDPILVVEVLVNFITLGVLVEAIIRVVALVEVILARINISFMIITSI